MAAWEVILYFVDFSRLGGREVGYMVLGWRYRYRGIRAVLSGSRCMGIRLPTFGYGSEGRRCV